ncbi:sirohydrochlorin chelatase [Thalassobacter stenotrophicus]|uniref:Sirohydrochlorin cobaltochelatase n=2 Tax=Thalassobacter stenotrophicus TaxID=266809 RepID=A0A0P1FRE6_9RHOB|nr:sirohydrochlorin chelatase [Thalassobacter stenotrophicus]PVZ49163.1 sirohydrochlorin chelatase [Thalassobacter stenotrophicus]CUH61840.1 Sirohydrochlorin cobaltochelatase [Thalassobacter stenotrophicus]SHI40851.1 sirohydrochlorin cobaltochelatase [Thalassobacter stenotrophicus DSM 16310]
MSTTSPQKTGVMICGHGSRSQSAVDEFATLAEKLPAHLPAEWEVDYGYLEFANPVIRDGLDALRAKGCTRILAVPGMLFAAMHAKNDIPTVLNTYAQKNGLQVSYGRELGVDPKMVSAAAARIREVAGDGPYHDTCLVVIGRGASDPDANGNVAKIARLLHEGLGFGWCEVGYSGVTFPLVEPCLQHAAKLGYKRIVVFPYFLFSGILIDRIYGFTDQVAAQHPEIEFLKAGYLGDHVDVLRTFAERVIEQDSATPPPNCGLCAYREQVLALEDGRHHHIKAEDRQHPAFGAVPPSTCVMCKYRTAVLGFEAEVGAVQESHHHHVEGQGANAPGSNVADCKLCDTFCTGMCRLEMQDAHAHHHHHDHGHGHAHNHDHGHHHHAEYPHAKHPHGPESARKRVKS